MSVSNPVCSTSKYYPMGNIRSVGDINWCSEPAKGIYFMKKLRPFLRFSFTFMLEGLHKSISLFSLFLQIYIVCFWLSLTNRIVHRDIHNGYYCSCYWLYTKLYFSDTSTFAADAECVSHKLNYAAFTFGTCDITVEEKRVKHEIFYKTRES